ncbi:MAG: ATP-binding protein [Cyanobacteria bacterium J06635_15]
MNFSRTRQWLTVGFGVALITLLGTAMIARQAIVHRFFPMEWSEDERDGYTYLNELLITIAEAEVNQKNYLERGQEEALEGYYEQLEIIDIYLTDFSEEYEALEGDATYREALEGLEMAVEAHIDLLELGIELKETGLSDPSAQLEIIREMSESKLIIQQALQALLDEGSIEQQWDIADTTVSINNAFWFTGVAVGTGIITLSVLYGWLLQTLRRQEQVVIELQSKNQAIIQNLQTKTVDLKSAKAALNKALGQRQAIETTVKEIEEAKEITDLKLNFFSLASHELRTPLSAILVSAQLLDNPKAEWSEAKRSRNLRRIQSSAKTMTQLLADILLLTRAEAGKLEFNPQNIDLQDFCNRLIEEVKFNTQALQSIPVRHQGECEYAHLDEKILRALLMGLLTNAIKYSPQESEIQLSIWGEHGHTRFQISDQGIGIPPADQQHLFDSFHRGQNVQTVSGTGLGLAVVKKCLDLHGGTIEVDSQVGIGTTFKVDIPWVDSPADNSRAKIAES